MNRNDLIVRCAQALVAAALIMSGCAARQAATVNPGLERIIENTESTFRIDTLPAGHGTGVVITQAGHILTCAHVVDDEAVIRVNVGTGDSARAYAAEIVAIDREADLAVIKIARRFRRAARIEDLSRVSAGDELYSIGYPYDFGELVSRGHIMKLHYDLPDFRLPVKDGIIVHMPEGPGASGAGMFSARSGGIVGLMRMSIWVTSGSRPPFQIHVLVSSDTIRRFLDSHEIPYSMVDGASHSRSLEIGDGTDLEVEISIDSLSPQRNL